MPQIEYIVPQLAETFSDSYTIPIQSFSERIRIAQIAIHGGTADVADAVHGARTTDTTDTTDTPSPREHFSFERGETVYVTKSAAYGDVCPHTGVVWDTGWIDQMNTPIEWGEPLTVLADFRLGAVTHSRGVLLSNYCYYPWWCLQKLVASSGTLDRAILRANARARLAERLTPELKGRWRHGWDAVSAHTYKVRGQLNRVAINELVKFVKGENPTCAIEHVAQLAKWPRIPHMPVCLRPVIARYDSIWNKYAYEYQKPGWLMPSHDTYCFVRVSDEDPMQVCYLQNVSKMMHGASGLWTRCRPGRYLTRFHPELDAGEVKRLVAEYTERHSILPLKTSEAQEDFIRVINEGPSESCMSAGSNGSAHWFAGHIHPAAVYAAGDVELLWLEQDGKILARTLANKSTKECSRIYGDQARMLAAMEKAGYSLATEALVDCRLLKIEDEGGHGYIMPYVDAGTGSGGGNLCYRDMGEHFVLSTDSNYASTYTAGYENKGVTVPNREVYCCPRCDAEHDDEDELHYSEYEDAHYCSSCEGDFVLAYVGLRDMDMVLEDNAVYLNGTWYADDSDVFEVCNIARCDVCNDPAHMDNMHTTSRGHICGCTELVWLREEDHEGNIHAHPDDVVVGFARDDLDEELMFHEDFEFAGSHYVLERSAEHLELLQQAEANANADTGTAKVAEI